jgi:hypothetical protein
MMIPRGKYLGERVGGPPKDEAEHFASGARAVAGGLIAATLLKCSSTKGRCRTRRRINRNTGAQSKALWI